MKIRKEVELRRPAAVVCAVLCAGGILVLSGCSTAVDQKLSEESSRCEALTGSSIASAAFGLPTRSATIRKAVFVSKDALGGGYCKVEGRIDATDNADLPINYQVNLPVSWNGKTVQYGGGGSNGVVITGTENFSHAPVKTPTPLAQGYVTYGGDSGHTTKDKDWLNNPQAFANYAGESVKRTHDAAAAVIKSFYGQAAKSNYFIGGSKGGQEGLVAAQRYADDYDGVVSFYPAARAFMMQMAWGTMGYAAKAPGAALNNDQQQLVRSRVLEACDNLDGLEDGLIGRVDQCRKQFVLDSLKCPAGSSGNSSSCLTEPQLQGLRVAATPLTFEFPFANGKTSIGPFPVLEGADFGWILYPSSWAPWGKLYVSGGDDAAKQASGDPKATLPGFDYRKYRSQIQAISKIYDASSPDLDKFQDKGGKLLLIQGTTDMLVPHPMTTDYYQSLESRYGKKLENFAAYYIQPGFDHGAGEFSLSVDSLAALDKWVNQGAAPGDLVAIDVAKKTRNRSRPLCQYPAVAQYKGTGDVNRADSFECVKP